MVCLFGISIALSILVVLLPNTRTCHFPFKLLTSCALHCLGQFFFLWLRFLENKHCLRLSELFSIFLEETLYMCLVIHL